MIPKRVALSAGYTRVLQKTPYAVEKQGLQCGRFFTGHKGPLTIRKIEEVVSWQCKTLFSTNVGEVTSDPRRIRTDFQVSIDKTPSS